MAELEALIEAAQAWADADVCLEDRAEARDLIARARSGDVAAQNELREAFRGPLNFGTAGLRGRIGIGPGRMNRSVVSLTSAGFAQFLHERAAAGQCASPPSVVIGYDGRRLSDRFAQDAAEVLSGAGVRVTMLPTLGPTPLTAFAVRYQGVSAGVMITASHNPPSDNGYKVYLGDADGGAQIAPPVDVEITEQIERVARGSVSELPRSTEYEAAGSEVADAYIARTVEVLREGWGAEPEAPVRVVYTALHGVGSALSKRIFEAAGLPTVDPVAAQDRPDGTFPTVDFPNPEEPGALDLAYEQARNAGADLVLAHDPDADRLAIAPRDPESPAGYRRLTGNELGLLLGWRAAERELLRAEQAGEKASGTLACTLVSSPALRAVADDYGLDYRETLSGFKWVSRVPGLIYGFEEALGYLTHPAVVRDKDGISAAADALAMARECLAEGRTIWQLLDEASARFGHFASDQIVFRFDTVAEAAELLETVRQDPPSEFAGVRVSQVQDLLDGSAGVPANVMRFDLADGSRIMLRPSGTEPKLKIYLDVFSDVGTVHERRAATAAQLAALREDLNRRLAP